MTIRPETPDDIVAVRTVNTAAFPTQEEADIVDALRERASPLVSLVAEVDGEVAGHIMFSPVTSAGDEALKLMGLAPMAVAPSYQRKGAGSALVRAGLDECRKLGTCAIVVLGHPDYYPRFGFVRASLYDIRCEYDAPDEAFMLLELSPGCMNGASGVVRFHGAFGIASD